MGVDYVFESGQVSLGPIDISDDAGPFIAVYWRSRGIQTYGCETIHAALAMMAEREMEGQIVSIALVDRQALEPLCQFVDPHGYVFYRTVSDAHACRDDIRDRHVRRTRRRS